VSTKYSDIELIQIQANVLFVYNSHNRLLRLNELNPTHPAPQFFLSRCTSGNIWRVRHDLPATLKVELERLATNEPIIHELNQSPSFLGSYTELLEQHMPITSVGGGPSYMLPEHLSSDNALLITSENIDLLKANFSWGLTEFDECSPFAVIVEDGKAVAACFTARSTSLAAEAGVFTIETHRKRGYALEAVRGWSNAVSARGKIPLYSTSWSNVASQSIAKKLGAIPYGATFDIT